MQLQRHSLLVRVSKSFQLFLQAHTRLLLPHPLFVTWLYRIRLGGSQCFQLFLEALDKRILKGCCFILSGSQHCQLLFQKFDRCIFTCYRLFLCLFQHVKLLLHTLACSIIQRHRIILCVSQRYELLRHALHHFILPRTCLLNLLFEGHFAFSGSLGLHLLIVSKRGHTP